MGRNGAGKTTLVNALLANSPTTPEAELRKTSGYDGPFVDGGKVIWGHEASMGYFAQDHHSADRAGHHGSGVAASVGSRRPSTEEIRGLLGQMLFPREDANEADRRTFRRRSGEAAVLQTDAAEAERAGAGRADQPSGSGVDQRAQHFAATLPGNRAAGYSRSTI